MGTIPITIGDFPELTILSLARNAGLSGILPGEIGNLDKLTQLMIGDTDL